MDISLVTLAIVATLLSINASEVVYKRAAFQNVCYPNVGCFNNSAPYNYANGKVPESPADVGCTLHLYNRAHRNSYETLSYHSTSSHRFDPAKLTKLIIHGFNNARTTQWVLDFKDALLNKGNYNVIVVGWGAGASGLDYFQAAANVRMVAAQISMLLENLETKGLNLADVHLIGHSLGAHVSGQVGHTLGGRIGRISGMDPAQPDFDHKSTVVRLDKTDATFVDVYHTDSNSDSIVQGGYGLAQISGDVDYYVNGGGPQPGCEGHDGLSGILGGLIGKRGLLDMFDVSCSHGRAHDYYLESIVSDCVFMGYPCTSWDEFQKGHCLDCSQGGCTKAGFMADSGSGKQYFMTNSQSPFCGYQYRLYMHIHTTAQSTEGTVSVSLVGTNGQTSYVKITHDDAAINRNYAANLVLLFDKDVGDVTAIKVKYDKADNQEVFLPISGVTVIQGQTGKSFTTCTGKYTLTTGHSKNIPAHPVDGSTPTSCMDMSVFN